MVNSLKAVTQAGLYKPVALAFLSMEQSCSRWTIWALGANPDWNSAWLSLDKLLSASTTSPTTSPGSIIPKPLRDCLLRQRAYTERPCSVAQSCLFATSWTVAHQAPPSKGFPRQEYWSGLPFPPPGDSPNPGMNPPLPHWQADSLHWASWEAPQAPGQLSMSVFVPGPKVSQALPSSAGPSDLPRHQGEGNPVSTLSRVPGKVVAQWPVASPASSPEGEPEKRGSVTLPEDTWVNDVNYLFSWKNAAKCCGKYKIKFPSPSPKLLAWDRHALTLLLPWVSWAWGRSPGVCNLAIEHRGHRKQNLQQKPPSSPWQPHRVNCQMTYAIRLFLAISPYSSDQCVSSSQRTDSACWEPQLHCGRAALCEGLFSGQRWQMKEACQLSAFPIRTTAFPPYEASACSMWRSNQGNQQESKFLCIRWDLASWPINRGTTTQGVKKQCCEVLHFFFPSPLQ